MPAWRGAEDWPDEKKQIWETQRNAMRKVESLFTVISREELDATAFKPWFVHIADVPKGEAYLTLGGFAILKAQFLQHAEPQGTRRMTPGESHAVRDTVFDHGIILPVLVEADGTVFDGYHRIQNELLSTCDGDQGREIPHIFVRFSSEENRAKAIRILNTARRHETTRERLRELEKMLLDGDNRTDAWVGSDLAIDPKTVARVRETLERSGRLHRLGTRLDPTGRRYKVRSLPPAEDCTLKGIRCRRPPKFDELVAPLSSIEAEEIVRLAGPGLETSKLITALARVSPTWFRRYGISPVTIDQITSLLHGLVPAMPDLDSQLQNLTAMFSKDEQLEISRFRVERTKVGEKGLYVYQLLPVSWSVYGPLAAKSGDAATNDGVCDKR